VAFSDFPNRMNMLVGKVGLLKFYVMRNIP
jgi:hypothetical protein